MLEFSEDALFTIGVKGNSIMSSTIKGGDLLRRQDNVLSGVEYGDLIVWSSFPRKQP